MSAAPLSFEVQDARPERVVQAFVERFRRLPAARTGILFVAGDLVAQLPAIAQQLAQALASEWRVTPRKHPPVCLLAGGVGVLTERGELEKQSAAVGLVLDQVQPLGLTSGPRLDAFADQLGEALIQHPSASAFTLVRPEQFEEDLLSSLRHSRRRAAARRIFGGGSASHQDVFIVTADGVSQGAGAALLLEGLPARIASSPAGRLLGPLRRVTECRGSMVLRIDGERALDVLSASAKRLVDQPLVLLALAPDASSHTADEPGRPSPPPVLLRPIHGVDPTRGGVLLGDEVRAGTRVAFAVRDATIARSAFEEQLRQLAREVAGAAPRFGIYANCAGRGTALYGTPHVDVKLVRSRFRDLPLVGLHTTFELSPYDDAVAVQLYSGVLGLFCVPS